jgi:ferric-dicitrate binding protein FerR (iron transport regulator)
MDELQPYVDIAELAARFLQGELTVDEWTRLMAWVEADDRNRIFWEKLTHESYLQRRLDEYTGTGHGAAWRKLEAAVRAGAADTAAGSEATAPGAAGTAVGAPWPVEARSHFWRRACYAAAAAAIIALCYFGYRREIKPTPASVVAKVLDDITPGSSKARLVLGNGRVLALGSAIKDTIRQEDGSQAAAGRSELRYARAGADLDKTAEFNTMITPRGGEYQLVLSDGTKVWLNAASSIRYPTRFTGPERKVYLQGEAYLEVARDVQHPFKVCTPKTDITVLGTSFNIKSYADETYERTSLVDGRVRVATKTGDAVTLLPGMQSMMTSSLQSGDADLEEALAWRNGLFVFEHESLESICRKLSRWYNVDFRFDDPSVKRLRFTGRVKRDDHITGLLHMLESTYHVKFDQSGFVLTVKAE